MICVLRIGGTTMNRTLVRQALGVEPYRMDVRGAHGAKVDCFYYDVVDEGGLDPEQVVSKIEHFLSSHSVELTALARLEGVEFRNLDIALMLYEDRASVSLDLSETLIRRLSELRLSLSVSTYPARSSVQSDGEAGAE